MVFFVRVERFHCTGNEEVHICACAVDSNTNSRATFTVWERKSECWRLKNGADDPL